MGLKFGTRWLLITYIALSIVLTAMMFISGCTSNNTSVNPTNIFTPEGKINLRVKTVKEASVTYGRGAPDFFIDPEIPLKNLDTVGLFVSKMVLIADNGEETVIYREDGMLSEPTFYLRNGGESENLIFLNDVSVKARNYIRLEMSVGRVWVKYKTSDTSPLVSWDSQNFNRNIILTTFSQLTVKPSENITVSANFELGGRVGKKEGEFYPYAYLLKE